MIVESASEATVKDLDGGGQERMPLERVHEWVVGVHGG